LIPTALLGVTLRKA